MRGEKWLKVLKNQPLIDIKDKKIIKFTDMGNVKEIMCIEKLNIHPFPIKKLSKTEYLVLADGEVKEYSFHADSRVQNKDALRKTFKTIRELINTNFQGNKNELSFTLTYGENMTDTKRLYTDFKRFYRKLTSKYPNIDYISVVEPQGRGAWHCHILLRFNDLSKIYIPNKEIAEMWGGGFTKVKAINKNVDNMGAYLSAYLGDVEVNDDSIPELISQGIIKPGQALNIKEVIIDGKSKKFIKGARLGMYPVGMNIFRASRGIKKPIVSKITYAEAKKIVGAVTPNYSTKINILDDDNRQINSITYEQYNMKRQNFK